jgi:hypothetical protein
LALKVGAARSGLLYDVRQFVRQQAVARWRARLE